MVDAWVRERMMEGKRCELSRKAEHSAGTNGSAARSGELDGAKKMLFYNPSAASIPRRETYNERGEGFGSEGWLELLI